MMLRFRYVLVNYWCFLNVVFSVKTENDDAVKPNIIVIIADDLGWNDVGFHGSNQIPTPNIDALAYNGIVLNRHYVQPTCTPSRVALMTGKYPIKIGLQGDPGRAFEPWALPLEEKILPQYLKRQGYKTHLVGKWHLGFYKTVFTPTKRGFDSHFGYYNGWIRYNDSVMSSPPFVGIDARRNLKPAGDEFVDQYATDVFTKEAMKIIKNHDSRTPMFLEISHVAVHAVKNNILQVRDEQKNDQQFGNRIHDEQRKLFAGTLQALDQSVGMIMKALKEADLLKNSVVLFISDNGGATEDPHWHFQNSASNWPLRGMKTSLFEGGIRGVAAIWSPLFANKNRVINELFHISDWLPTFFEAAGGDLKKLRNIDGISQWSLLTAKTTHTNRQEILVNINHRRNNSAIIYESWKLISNNKTHRPTFADNYAGVTGRQGDTTYDLEGVLSSTTNRVIFFKSSSHSEDLFLRIRATAMIDFKCLPRISNDTQSPFTAQCYGDCLYDLENDPCEFSNVAHSHPDIVMKLKKRLNFYESITVPQMQANADLRANPTFWNGYWNPWLDDEIYTNSSKLSLFLVLRGILTFSVAFLFWKKLDRFFIVD